MAKGVYKDGGHAAVDDGAHRNMIPRDTYEERRHRPPFDDLPTREEYERQQNAGKRD